MSLRIGARTWNTVEELEELQKIVAAALEETKQDERYFNHINLTNNLRHSIEDTVKALNESTKFYNVKTGQTFRIEPGDMVLISTDTMTKWETEQS